MSGNAILGVLPFFGICFVVALSGAIFRPGEWYEHLAKPPWRPPNWLFGPAWTVLYVCIAIAGYLVWSEAGWGLAMTVYAVQLALNAGWSGVCFGMRRLDLAFGELVLLWLSIASSIVLFSGISTAATLLFVPYLAWVTFAGALNFRLWQLNRTRVAASLV